MTGWIPVTERLPEAYADVLVTIDEKRSERRVVKTAKRTAACWAIHIYALDDRYERVVSWMPLPEPDGRP